MLKEMPKEIAKFEMLIESAGGAFTAEMALQCIELARQMMLRGETSVENYYACKHILLNRVETANGFMH
jgi:hypothetical protein